MQILTEVLNHKAKFFFTPNAEGGTDTISEGTVVAPTQLNMEGGVNIYNGDMNLEDMTVPNEFGNEDYISVQGNSNEIISYDDPLAYSSQYRMSALIF